MHASGLVNFRKAASVLKGYLCGREQDGHFIYCYDNVTSLRLLGDDNKGCLRKTASS